MHIKSWYDEKCQRFKFRKKKTKIVNVDNQKKTETMEILLKSYNFGYETFRVVN